MKWSKLVQIWELFFDNKPNWNQLSEIQTSSDFGIPLHKTLQAAKKVKTALENKAIRKSWDQSKAPVRFIAKQIKYYYQEMLHAV